MKTPIIIVIISLSTYGYSQTYTETASNLGIEHIYGSGSSGGGVSFYDFNQDGWDDITLASQQNQKIYFYKNNGGSFELLSPLVSDLSEIKQILWVDFDNDGDTDYVIGNYGLNSDYKASAVYPIRLHTGYPTKIEVGIY